TPEIQRSDLAEVVLLLHSLGIKRAAEFDWLDKPDPQAVERAERLLITLGALRDLRSTIYDLRAQEATDASIVSRKSLMEAAKFSCVPAAALCAALVSGRNLLMRLGRDDKHMQEARDMFQGSQESD